jgi:pimeloyl-ACP methyl ester carboxylesterase
MVVLHGGPGAPGSAAGLAKALADSFVVLEPLQRRSGHIPLTVARHVNDLRAVAPRPATIVGWSWGAMLGLSFAARYPQDVSALILVGCGTYDETSRSLFRSALERRLKATERDLIATLESRLDAEPTPGIRDALFGELGAACLKAESYDVMEDAGDETDDLPADDLGHVETWNDALRLQREGIEPESFRRIAAPVLMIHGDTDPHPGPATRDVLRRCIPQLEYVELDRCGHAPWRERYGRAPFIEIVCEWCNEQITRSAQRRVDRKSP